MKFLTFLRLFFGGRIFSNVANVKFIDDEKCLGFAQFYDQKIHPKAIEIEEGRIKHLKKIIWRAHFSTIILAVFTTVIISKSVHINSSLEDISLYYYLVITPLIFWAWLPILSYKKSIKSDLFSEILKFFGDFSYFPGGQKSEIESFEKFGIVPNHDKSYSKTEDLITGKYKDVALRFEEWILEKNLGKYSYKVFRGATILLSFNKNFHGKTIVKNDGGMVGNFLKKNLGNIFSDLEKVDFEDPEFEKMFEVYSSDQIEARYLITTSFMERLKGLSKFFESKKVEAGFCQNELFLMFHNSKNLFEPGSIFKEVSLISECKTVIEQMSLIFDLIGFLKLDQRTGL
ncbi:MAG: DUF3137 domain-containing protein [Proteobacteria bacterium]|nr:DUF3137 domain-containing protein [Pseudomonadota bacterium]